MKLLAIDTSTAFLSIALYDNGIIRARVHRNVGRNHSRLLVPAIQKMLARAHCAPAKLDAFCISIGPGSFTGLRIAVATVKVLAYTLNKPIIAVPTLDVIAYNAAGFRGIICPILDARKGKVYACLYRSDGKKIKRMSKYLLVPIAELLEKLKAEKEEILFLGDGIPQSDTEKVPVKNWYPRATIAAQLAIADYRRKKFVPPKKLEPLYLYSRECDIKGI